MIVTAAVVVPVPAHTRSDLTIGAAAGTETRLHEPRHVVHILSPSIPAALSPITQGES